MTTAGSPGKRPRIDNELFTKDCDAARAHLQTLHELDSATQAAFMHLVHGLFELIGEDWEGVPVPQLLDDVLAKKAICDKIEWSGELETIFRMHVARLAKGPLVVARSLSKSETLAALCLCARPNMLESVVAILQRHTKTRLEPCMPTQIIQTALAYADADPQLGALVDNLARHGLDQVRRLELSEFVLKHVCLPICAARQKTDRSVYVDVCRGIVQLLETLPGAEMPLPEDELLFVGGIHDRVLAMAKDVNAYPRLAKFRRGVLMWERATHARLQT